MPFLAEIEARDGQRAEFDGDDSGTVLPRVCMKHAKHSALACPWLFWWLMIRTGGWRSLPPHRMFHALDITGDGAGNAVIVGHKPSGRKCWFGTATQR
jgi:hypothetical protein